MFVTSNTTTVFLAHRIRISEILSGDRKSYLTHAILPRTLNNVFLRTCILVYSGTSGSLLAHLSRRLVGELIVYQSLRRPSVVRPSTISNIFSSETTGRIELKFHMETPLDGGMKVCSNGPGHMTKMAAMPIYGKNPLKIFFSRTRRPLTLGLGM